MIYSKRLNLYEEHLALIPIEIPNDPKAGNAMQIKQSVEATNLKIRCTITPNTIASSTQIIITLMNNECVNESARVETSKPKTRHVITEFDPSDLVSAYQLLGRNSTISPV